jgi:hypothetical protein
VRFHALKRVSLTSSRTVSCHTHTAPANPPCRRHLCPAQGLPVIVSDDDDRENEADLIMAADNISPPKWPA